MLYVYHIYLLSIPLQIPKKRRIVARVQCRNIKNECPPAKCDDPISLPGKCCKTCPGDRNGKCKQYIPYIYISQVRSVHSLTQPLGARAKDHAKHMRHRCDKLCSIYSFRNRGESDFMFKAFSGEVRGTVTYKFAKHRNILTHAIVCYAL